MISMPVQKECASQANSPPALDSAAAHAAAYFAPMRSQITVISCLHCDSAAAAHHICVPALPSFCVADASLYGMGERSHASMPWVQARMALLQQKDFNAYLEAVRQQSSKHVEQLLADTDLCLRSIMARLGGAGNRGCAGALMRAATVLQASQLPAS